MPKHENLAAALAAFQAELPKLRKDESAKVTGESQSGAKISYTYGYADLAQVVEAVSMCLGQHGLAFSAFPTMTDQGFVLSYALLHEGGEERTGVWPLPDPMRVKPQQLGSAITYARRYAQMAVTNTFPDKEDDDGAAAVPTGHRDQAMSPEQFDQLPKNRPVSAPPAPAKTVWTDDEVRDLHGKLTGVELAKAVNGYDWMAARGLHERKVSHPSRPEESRTATEVLAGRMAFDAFGNEDPRGISDIRAYAEARGLLKVQVSETETLDQVLYEARELAVHATVEQAKAHVKDATQ